MSSPESSGAPASLLRSRSQPFLQPANATIYVGHQTVDLVQLLLHAGEGREQGWLVLPVAVPCRLHHQLLRLDLPCPVGTTAAVPLPRDLALLAAREVVLVQGVESAPCVLPR